MSYASLSWYRLRSSSGAGLRHAEGPRARAVYVRALYVRVLGRRGALNQHGATVCLRFSNDSRIVSCQAIDSGGGSLCQAPYDLHFGLPDASATYDITVGYVNGHGHNASAANSSA